MTQPPIGIDLGTTNSLIAVFRDGRPDLIPNALGQMLTPSVVSVDAGRVLVGPPRGTGWRRILATAPPRSSARWARTARCVWADRSFAPRICRRWY
jgi:molecular chaperone HscC